MDKENKELHQEKIEEELMKQLARILIEGLLANHKEEDSEVTH